MADVIGVLKGLVGSFGACVCFALLFHTPRHCLLGAALTGLAGYAGYLAGMALINSTVGASFIGALVVALMSEWLARRKKAPAIIFSMIGIVPLVPGAGLYRTMLSLVLEEYDQAAQIGVETVLISAGIALAVAVVTATTRGLRRAGERKPDVFHSDNRADV